MISGESGHRAQYGSPLKVIERTAHAFVFGEQEMVFDIENARRVIGALDVNAKSRKPIRVVAQHGAVRGAVKAQRGLLHPPQKTGELFARSRSVSIALELKPGAVDRVPHFHCQGSTHGAGIATRKLKAGTNGR